MAVGFCLHDAITFIATPIRRCSCWLFFGRWRRAKEFGNEKQQTNFPVSPIQNAWKTATQSKFTHVHAVSLDCFWWPFPIFTHTPTHEHSLKYFAFLFFGSVSLSVGLQFYANCKCLAFTWVKQIFVWACQWSWITCCSLVFDCGFSLRWHAQPSALAVMSTGERTLPI